MAKRTVYRDTKTGRFVKRSTWKRSKAHGGTRFKRSSVERHRRAAVPPTVPPPVSTLPPGDYPVKVQATRKGKRGTHEKLLDIRVITRRAASREEITEALKEAATGRSQSLLKVKTIAWSRKSGEMHKGNAGDLQQFAAVILAPEDVKIEE